MVSTVLLALKDKTGIQQSDHVVALLDKTGMEPLVFLVLAEDNGTPSAETAPVPTGTGTDSLAFNALLVKDGILQLFHALALKTLSGMDFPA